MSGPEEVVQEGTLMDSWEQPDTLDSTQSPHLLGMTVPVESVSVAHQDTGESA